MEFPRVVRVRQHFPDRSIADIGAEVRRTLAAARLADRVPPGGSVAIGVGSRGISNLAVIVREVVDYWRENGRKPFLFPSMGSHGAATAEGQAAVLEHYGVTEAAMGCPLRSRLEVADTGTTPEGIETCMDRLALASDGVMLVNRIKWHTDFAGKIESGLFKMMAIGLGKLIGAKRYHTCIYKMGYEPVIRSVGRQILKTGKIVGGLAILEDANHHTARVAALDAGEMERKEEELLATAKQWMGRIPVPEIDILILDEIGKNISGTGMDTKVVNRASRNEYNPWPGAPQVERVFLRSLNPLSYGNGAGIGMADAITNRLLEAIDWEPTIVNSLAASTFTHMRIPMHFPTDRECLEKLAPSVGKFDLSTVTYCRIRNSLELGRAIVSENLLPAIENNERIEVLGKPAAMEFDEEGNLTELLAEDQVW